MDKMSDKRKCDGCGMDIKDQQKAVVREGHTYCSAACAEQAKQKL